MHLHFSCEVSRAAPPPLSISLCIMDLFGRAVKRGIFFVCSLLFNLSLLYALLSHHAFSYASMCMVLKILSLIPTSHMKNTCTPTNCCFYICPLKKKRIETRFFQIIYLHFFFNKRKKKCYFHLYPSFFVLL